MSKIHLKKASQEREPMDYMPAFLLPNVSGTIENFNSRTVSH